MNDRYSDEANLPYYYSGFFLYIFYIHQLLIHFHKYQILFWCHSNSSQLTQLFIVVHVTLDGLIYSFFFKEDVERNRDKYNF